MKRLKTGQEIIDPTHSSVYLVRELPCCFIFIVTVIFMLKVDDPHQINFYLWNEVNIGASFLHSVVTATFFTRVPAIFTGLDKKPCNF